METTSTIYLGHNGHLGKGLDAQISKLVGLLEKSKFRVFYRLDSLPNCLGAIKVAELCVFFVEGGKDNTEVGIQIGAALALGKDVRVFILIPYAQRIYSVEEEVTLQRLKVRVERIEFISSFFDDVAASLSRELIAFRAMVTLDERLAVAVVTQAVL